MMQGGFSIVIKRALDVLVASLGLVLLSPLLVTAAFLVKATSPGPVFFRQERIGRKLRPFSIYKFRSMVADCPPAGREITIGEDSRITRVGRILRRTKIDELPQLLNVLKGDMSLVGPRPEVPKYVAMFHKDFEEILQIRPGITDLASIEYRDEAAILARAPDPEQQYVRVVLPRKIGLARQYLRRTSLALDLEIIVRTLFALVREPSRM
jgi:lipopolysaccharide/colanic/teichoic acid biosynthesis glycosyltransferase